MVGAKRMKHKKRSARGSICQRFGGAAFSLHCVPGWLAVNQGEMTVRSDTETRDRVVSAIGRKQTPSIGRDYDTGRALKGIRRALLAADRLESSGTRAAREATLHLGKLAVHR